MFDLTVTEQIFIGWIIAHAFVTGWALTLLYYVKRRCDDICKGYAQNVDGEKNGVEHIEME